MTAANRTLAVLAGLSVAVSAFPVDAQKAKELLMRTMLRNPSHNVTAVIVQRMVDEPGRMQQIQVMLNREGMSRHTVLTPLSLQGLDSLDDGKTCRTYLPDKKMVIEMKSPRTMDRDASARMKLAERNYRFRTEDGPKIAGRDSSLVIATPRNRSLAERRYYIDPKTGYLLKLETLSGGKPVTTFETRFVEYPRDLPSNVFVFQSLSGHVKVVAQTPKGIGDPETAAEQMGFTPILPRSLPLGFVIEDTEIVNPDRGNMVGVRITDGLVKGTVYQWSANDERRSVAQIQGASMVEVGATRVMLIADVPEEAREKLLGAFRSATRKVAVRAPQSQTKILCLRWLPSRDFLELPIPDGSFHTVSRSARTLA